MLRKTHGLIPPISPSEHVKTHARIGYCTTYILCCLVKSRNMLLLFYSFVKIKVTISSSVDNTLYKYQWISKCSYSYIWVHRINNFNASIFIKHSFHPAVEKCFWGFVVLFCERSWFWKKQKSFKLIDFNPLTVYKVRHGR